MDWKGVGEKLIVAIVAGAILGGAGWMLGRATAPDAPSIRADAFWVDIPNPVYPSSDINRFSSIDKALGVQGIGEILGRTGYEVRIGKLNIQNTSSVRSKQIEVSIQLGGMIQGSGRGKDSALLKEIVVNPIDGNGKTSIFFATHARSFSTAPLKIIYDDRNVDIAQASNETMQVINQAPAFAVPLLAALGMLGLFSAVVIIAALILAVVTRFYPDVGLRNITPAMVEKMMRQLDQIKEKYPEKLPKSKAENESSV